MNICKHLGWTTSVLAMSVAATSVSAQDTGAPGGEPAASPQEDTADTEAQGIVITGIRASQKASIDAKRNLGVVADVLTAEDIGKFPDKNVAEALQRVPGVVINREFGEGERVSLRGTAPNLTKTLVNGHGIATADWFVLEQLSATRSFNYLTLPSEIVGQLEVYKSPQADVEEGGIGATINVNTRDPLDLAAWTVSGSAQGVYSDKRGSIDPQVSGLISWKNASETFGVLVGGVYQKRKIRRDGVEVLGYFDYPVNGATVSVPSLIGSALFEQERERYGGNIGIQLRPSDQFELNVTGLYSKFNANNFNQNFLAWGSNALGGGGTLTDPTVTNGTVTSGRIDSIPDGRAAVYDAIDRTAFAETYSGDVDALIHPTDRTTIHLKAGYTEAHGDTASQPFYEGGAPGGFTFDLTGRTPQVGFTGLDPTNPADLAFDFGSLHKITNTDKEFYVYADIEQAIDLGPLTAIKFGGKYVDHNRDAAFLATTYGNFFLPLLASGCGGPCSSADFAGDPTPGDFLSNIALPGTLTNFFQIDRRRLRDIYNALPAANRQRIINPPENYSIRELSYGAYAMAKFQGQGYRGNVGVRVVRTEQQSTGNQIGIPAGPGTVNDNAFGVYLPVQVDRAYTDWLPSFNVAFDVTPEVVVRFGAARAIARPDYTDIVPRVSLNPGSLTAAGGNPLVDPYRSNQADLSIEYYPDNESIFAAALYYKDIKSYITDTIFQQNFPVQTSTPNTSRCTLLNLADNLYDCTFDVNQRANGPGGKNKGIELQASRRLFAGFGAILNYTYSDAKLDGGGQVPGNSKHSFNTTGYYEDNGISARLSHTYRSDFFITVDRAAPLNQKATESLDASLSYQLTSNVALTADAVNLTNHKIVQFSGTPDRPRAIYDNGRQFYAGFRVRF